jgi:hypothetical protein
MGQVLIRDGKIAGRKGLFFSQQDLSEASFYYIKNFNIVMGMVMALPGKASSDVAHAPAAEGVFVSVLIIQIQQCGERGFCRADIRIHGVRCILSRTGLRRRSRYPGAGDEVKMFICRNPLFQRREGRILPSQDIFL